MAGKDIHSILRRPLVTEKTTIQNEDNHQVVFRVRLDANKIEIKQAVETLLGAKVDSVNTLVYRGKMKRMGKKTGKRANWKKAVVTLAPGEEIEFFETLEELEDDAFAGDEANQAEE